MGSKIKYCKCGHENKQHQKNPNSKLSVSTFCRICQCNLYLNRNKPFKSDYGIMIFTVAFAAFLMILSAIMIIQTDPKLDGTQNDIVTFTVGELYDIISLVIIFANLYLVVAFVIDPIFEIVRAKKRPEFPIDDKNAQP